MKECTVLWLGKYQQKWENGLHQHNYFQLFAILGGSGNITIDDANYQIQKEVIYLVPPKSMHSLHCSPDNADAPKILDIKFTVQDSTLFDDLMALDCSFRIDDFSQIVISFDKMLSESAAHQKYYFNMVNVYLYELLVTTIRNKLLFSEVGREEIPIPIPTREIVHGINVQKLIGYIHENFSHIIALDDLSAMAGINKTTLICIFKELYGTTPIRYINRLRIHKAEELLMNTDTSIGEISELVGFQSIHYFSRYFKQKINCTPLEYRNHHNKNSYYSF